MDLLSLPPPQSPIAGWMSQDCEPGQLQDRSVLREEEVWLQEEMTGMAGHINDFSTCHTLELGTYSAQKNITNFDQ